MVDTDYIFRFSSFEYKTETKTLSTNTGKKIQVFGKSLDVLCVLLKAQGEVVSRDQILDEVWANSIVEDGNINVAISHLRKAFRDNGEKKEVIQTIAKRGYRIASQMSMQVVDEHSLKEFTNLKLQPGIDSTFDAELAERARRNKGEPLTPLHSNSVLPKSFINFAAAFQKKIRKALSSFYILAALNVLFVISLIVLQYVYVIPRTTESHIEKSIGGANLTVLPFRNNLTRTENVLGIAVADKLIRDLSRVDTIKTTPIWMVRDPYEGDTNMPNLDNFDGFVLFGSYIRDHGTIVVKVSLVRAEDNFEFINTSFQFEDIGNESEIRDLIVERVLTLFGLSQVFSGEQQMNNLENTTEAAYRHYINGIKYYFAEDYTRAEAEFSSSIELAPMNATAMIYLGRIRYTQAAVEFGSEEDLFESERLIRKAIDLEPDNLMFKVELGNLFVYKQEFEKANKIFQEVYEIDPSLPSLVYALSYSNRYVGKLKTSVALAEKYQVLSPRSRNVFLQFIYIGDYNGFKRWFPLSMDSSYAEFYRGYLKLYLGEELEAERHFVRAYTLNSELLQPLTGMIFKYLLEGNRKHAIEFADRVLRKIENQKIRDGEGVYKVAQGYAMAGETKTALYVMKMAIDSGFVPYQYFQNDPLMKNISDQPEYKELVAIAKKKSDSYPDILKDKP